MKFMQKINRLLSGGASSAMNEQEFLEREIARWKRSDERKAMITGERYYLGQQDILLRRRLAIGEGGELKEVRNLPNNRIIDNQYAKQVDQKVNYLFGRPISFDTSNADYGKQLRSLFGAHFHRALRKAGAYALNSGKAWIHPYFGTDGKMLFRCYPGYEILPFWEDREHTKLQMAVRLYEVEVYHGSKMEIVEKTEVLTADGIYRYELRKGKLIPEIGKEFSGYIEVDGKAETEQYTWERLPLIALKANSTEKPLIKDVKCLQDGINEILSDFANNMQEDYRNTILVVHNYDGEDLGELRRNLITYGAVKVRTTESASGGVEALHIDVNSENYKAILEVFKKALIENARGFDAKDDRLSGNPNQMNIQSIYNDIDLDANGMEVEAQAAFEELLWFANTYFINAGKGDYFSEDVRVIFDRDVLINESESIANCAASLGILSQETIMRQHPWVTDPEQELERLKKEREEEMQPYGAYNLEEPENGQETDS
ncbi:MAG: phage portal protein [Clostridiales bacterium]|nr:phage portal protein [Clostridiales bacterium]